MPPPSGLPEEYDHAMQLHSAVTSSSSLTGTPDDVPQLPVGQAPGSCGAVRRVIYSTYFLLTTTRLAGFSLITSDHYLLVLRCPGLPGFP